MRERIGRYELFEPVGAGGMATVHLGRLRAESGFSRVVAIKRVHRHLAKNAEFSAMFFDEARVAMRVRHPNVVASFDVVAENDELLLVMEYVHGESLAALYRAVRSGGARVPPRVLVAIVCNALAGLHAAHEATGEDGAPLGLVHRDVSPQNVLVGADGVARVLDFGVAKAEGRLQETEDGRVKGKLAYASPEHLMGKPIDRRADLFSAAVVAWEGLVGARLFDGDSPGALVTAVLGRRPPPPHAIVHDLPPALGVVVARGLEKKPDARFASAREMAAALEAALPPATPREVGDWVARVAADTLRARAARVAEVEREPREDVDAPLAPAAPIELPTTASAIASDAEPATEVDPPRPPRSRARRVSRGAWAALVAVPLAALGAFVALRGAPHPARAASTASSAPLAASSAPLAAPPEAADLASAPPAEPAGAARADASVYARPRAPATSAPRRDPKRPAAPGAPSARRPDCRDPFTIDPRGLRIPRPECF